MVDNDEDLRLTNAAQPGVAPASQPVPPLPERWKWRPDQRAEPNEAHHPQIGATRTEARVELYHSHALDHVAALLQSFDEGFTHVMFDRAHSETILSDEYASTAFHVEYRLCEQQRDQLRISWADQAADRRHSDAELLALARQIAEQLGGGTNLCLIEVATE